MSDQIVQVKAGIPANVQASGAYLLVVDTGAAASVGVELRAGSQSLEKVSAAKRGHKFRVVAGGFDLIVLTSAVDTAVELIVSNGIVDIDLVSGSTVQIANSGTPINVSNDRGSPGNPLYISGGAAGTGPASGIVQHAAVAVDSAGEALLTANVNRARCVFTNLDANNDVAIGGPGITWAQRAIVLRPGDTWIEDRAANLAWSAICASGLTASVGVQEVTA